MEEIMKHNKLIMSAFLALAIAVSAVAASCGKNDDSEKPSGSSGVTTGGTNISPEGDDRFPDNPSDVEFAKTYKYLIASDSSYVLSDKKTVRVRFGDAVRAADSEIYKYIFATDNANPDAKTTFRINCTGFRITDPTLIDGRLYGAIWDFTFESDVPETAYVNFVGLDNADDDPFCELFVDTYGEFTLGNMSGVKNPDIMYVQSSDKEIKEGVAGLIPISAIVDGDTATLKFSRPVASSDNKLASHIFASDCARPDGSDKSWNIKALECVPVNGTVKETVVQSWNKSELHFFNSAGEEIEPGEGQEWYIFPWWKGADGSENYDSNTDGQWVQATVIGSKFKIVFANADQNGHSNVEVYVDGNKIDTINLKTDLSGQNPEKEYEVEEGTHEIVVKAGARIDDQNNGFTFNSIQCYSETKVSYTYSDTYTVRFEKVLPQTGMVRFEENESVFGLTEVPDPDNELKGVLVDEDGNGLAGSTNDYKEDEFDVTGIIYG